MQRDFSRFADTTLFPERASVQSCLDDVFLNGTVQDHSSESRRDKHCQQTGVFYDRYWLADDRVTVDDITFLSFDVNLFGCHTNHGCYYEHCAALRTASAYVAPVRM